MLGKMRTENELAFRDLQQRHRSEIEDEDAEIERQEREIELMMKRFEEVNR
jgi:hypothetical protein